MRIALGADHAGFDLKEELRIELAKWGHTIIDTGCTSKQAADYPDFAHTVSRMVLEGSVERGILLCGTGIGMAIAANRHPGIRAALCHNCDMAYLSRAHNDANVLVLGARYTTFLDMRALTQVFLGTHFSGEDRHSRRIRKLDPAAKPDHRPAP